MIYTADNKFLDYAVSLLEDGDIIAYPTDTLYGIGVDATNTDVIHKVNHIKGRTQPLSIILENIEDIHKYAEMSNTQQAEIKNLFPGPYTVLLKKKESDLSPLITLDSPLIGIRIPKHPFPIQLVKALGKPIITTSINRHGTEPLNDISQVAIDFPDIIIFEDQVVKNSKGSTIVDLTQNKHKVIRVGDGKYPL
ncbi:MAG: threonylcarbamoyl-AMP synthase [Candidatus Marinimicrobia bacterium]|nr:threonylcarbamoyl-AMP synthase [Candidatus Neomarinimicrobiota bacterium]MBL7023511.1 threonylcarbamoyl-AMP synthase [Candidatus Neomarinimicrobiota bacterium]MBL7109413.1 threonylcarbamoyl-AMP synthase [Candidatus Neomarinimicrobiota bacterium]